jgi:sugar O-acyltransferase (sialic acid O-acetyltransferase NeuD family)
MDKIAIVGTGGFAREVYCLLRDLSAEYKTREDSVVFVEQDTRISTQHLLGARIIPMSALSLSEYKVVVAVGDSKLRKKIVENELKDAVFATVIHPSAVISDFCSIGDGSIICAGSILTCDLVIGKHAHLNLHVTVGHDCRVGDFFTAAPAVNVSGMCSIGETVYAGTNAAIRQGIHICGDVTIGMGAVVVKDIETPGTYVGNPAKQIN